MSDHWSACLGSAPARDKGSIRRPTRIALITRLRKLPSSRRIAELERALAHYYEKSCRLEYPEQLVIRGDKVEVVGTPKGR